MILVHIFGHLAQLCLGEEETAFNNSQGERIHLPTGQQTVKGMRSGQQKEHPLLYSLTHGWKVAGWLTAWLA